MSLLKSPYQNLIRDWKNCTRCPLHEFRSKVVMLRGRIPCDVAFVAEAPGVTEDLFGSPLVGPAGDELHEWIEEALQTVPEAKELRLGFMNVVGCYPNDPERKTPEPKQKEIDTCYPRIDGLLKLCKPRAIVLVGRIAEKVSIKHDWSSRKGVEKVVQVLHPSAYLKDRQKYDIDKQRAILNLEESFKLLIED